ncbi:MAG: STAS domain-containing protein [Planctomycetes bacterium]|nr:STAS domain-containing protein [Planctomycetota bacterium]
MAHSLTDTVDRCPVCGVELAARPCWPFFNGSCQHCGYLLWCFRVGADDVVVLSVVPDVMPEHKDIERLCEALIRSGEVARVVVDLSDIDYLDSLLTARFVALHRGIRAAEGRFVLCGLNRLVRDTLHYYKLDEHFELADQSSDGSTGLDDDSIESTVAGDP